MEELKHLQRVVLDIAKDVDNLCRENGIEYYLGGGGAIGTIRHKGYIPWDDDLDLLMSYDNYEKFVRVCEEKLDKEKYYLDRDTSPWAFPYCKIRLKGTYIEEKGDIPKEGDTNGIFVDVFRLEKSPSSSFWQHWQYYFSKVLVAYNCAHKPYETTSTLKKMMMKCSLVLNVGIVRKIIQHQVFRWNNKEVRVLGCFWGTTRFKNSFTETRIYGKPKYLPFEDTKLPVPEFYDEYLTQFFGNYMQLPPVEKRVAPHITKVDFGKF